MILKWSKLSIVENVLWYLQVKILCIIDEKRIIGWCSIKTGDRRVSVHWYEKKMY
jgi:hypothetical protein